MKSEPNSNSQFSMEKVKRPKPWVSRTVFHYLSWKLFVSVLAHCVFQRAKERTDLFKAKTGASKSSSGETFSWMKSMGSFATTNSPFIAR